MLGQIPLCVTSRKSSIANASGAVSTVSLVVMVLTASIAIADESDVVQTILDVHCKSCHESSDGEKQNFTYVADLLNVDTQSSKSSNIKLVVPGKPNESELILRLEATDEMKKMPPNGVLSDQDIKRVRTWIEHGAKISRIDRPFVSVHDLSDAIQNDLQDLARDNPRAVRFTRYFSLADVYNNQQITEEQLVATRHALSKLLNSLSWENKLVLPAMIVEKPWIYRIDIRDYSWSEEIWDKILARDKYPIELTASTEALTGTPRPVVRADFFIREASGPPLYHDILQLPIDERLLEIILGVDRVENFGSDKFARSGFDVSRISLRNRLLERQPSAFGSYWRSYDFAEGNRRGIKTSPLGPSELFSLLAQQGISLDEGLGFAHDGGEIIFNLPNGLQGYMLVDGNGRRIDAVAEEKRIVVDPFPGASRLLPRGVTNGISCFRCHCDGILDHADEVRDSSVNHGLNRDVQDVINAIYPDKSIFSGLVQEDRARYESAVSKLAIPLGSEGDEPIFRVFQRFEGDLGFDEVAIELGVSPQNREKFKVQLYTDPDLKNVVDGGKIKRLDFEKIAIDRLNRFSSFRN